MDANAMIVNNDNNKKKKQKMMTKFDSDRKELIQQQQQQQQNQNQQQQYHNQNQDQNQNINTYNNNNNNNGTNLYNYRDLSGNIQGPFTFSQLCNWNNSGFFPPYTPVQRIIMDGTNTNMLLFQPIGIVLAEDETKFALQRQEQQQQQQQHYQQQKQQQYQQQQQH